MKSILLAVAMTFVLSSLAWAQSAKQNSVVEDEIRKLDLAEVNAVLQRDVAALEGLWAEDLTVNNPRNGISRGRKEVLELVRSGSINYSSFVRETETVLIHGDTVILMGLEIVKPIGNAPFAGETVRRRFTDIWMKRDGKWLLTARHANVICRN
ncbi:MAG TPA: nuclear transport factor 2 family protein [Blastocatellia bacterium]|nr:nuclear transport factor 2 family protein [Blastocatellia bacterium]